MCLSFKLGSAVIAFESQNFCKLKENLLIGVVLAGKIWLFGVKLHLIARIFRLMRRWLQLSIVAEVARGKPEVFTARN